MISFYNLSYYGQTKTLAWWPSNVALLHTLVLGQAVAYKLKDKDKLSSHWQLPTTVLIRNPLLWPGPHRREREIITHEGTSHPSIHPSITLICLCSIAFKWLGLDSFGVFKLNCSVYLIKNSIFFHRLHTIPGLLCWMNERHTCMR